jgi:hypothetical protein
LAEINIDHFPQQAQDLLSVMGIFEEFFIVKFIAAAINEPSFVFPQWVGRHKIQGFNVY